MSAKDVAEPLLKAVPYEDQAELPDGSNRDPIKILTEQNKTRIQDLVGIRMGRMLESPFAFYRGAAAIMAQDFAHMPSTGLDVVSCGDAHVSNFGFFASPERRLLFDMNDFDEGGVAPWEWDLKRLATSIYIAGSVNGANDDVALKSTRHVASSYRQGLADAAKRNVLDRYYAALDADMLEQALPPEDEGDYQSLTKKARRRTSEQFLKKIKVSNEGGRFRIEDQPPLMRHTDLVDPENMDFLWKNYLDSVDDDVRFLLEQFRIVDVVLRVVGVGSVGTRCFIALLVGPQDTVLFLQIKEAQESVLSAYGQRKNVIPAVGDVASIGQQGHRVTAAQRIMQASSDPFLGWMPGHAADQGHDVESSYYWRQFRDMKGSVDLSALSPDQLDRTGQVCARLLARAHSQSATFMVAQAYVSMGHEKYFDDAIATFAQCYAAVNQKDYEALQAAADAGELPVQSGV